MIIYTSNYLALTVSYLIPAAMLRGMGYTSTSAEWMSDDVFQLFW
jgi:hypothetical protein